MTYARGTELTGIYTIKAVRTSRMSRNGVLILTGGDFPMETRVYCDMRTPGFASIEAGQAYHITFNDTSDVTAIRTANMFAKLTASELNALFIRIKSGRDHAYYATGKGADARYLVYVEASEIMTEIHIENATR